MEIGFSGTFILSCMNTSTYSRESNKCGSPSVEQFDKNLGQHLIVIVFRDRQQTGGLYYGVHAGWQPIK